MEFDDTRAVAPLLAVETEDEVRLFACLDRSSSMRRYDKYTLIASQYPRALRDLETAAPAAKVETWWFADDLTCFAALAPVAQAPVPTLEQHSDAIAGGSAIADCLVRAIDRAEAVRKESGEAPTKAVLWTDGWNRHSRHTPSGARAVMERSSWVEVFLIGFIDRAIRHEFDNFVGEIGLPPERVFIFEHDDNEGDVHRAGGASSEAFSSSARTWRHRHSS